MQHHFRSAWFLCSALAVLIQISLFAANARATPTPQPSGTPTPTNSTCGIATDWVAWDSTFAPNDDIYNTGWHGSAP